MSNKVPQIRFNGYTDAWVQRKAKDLFIPVNERNREDLPVLSVTQDQGVVFRNDLAIDIKYDESTLSSYKVIHPGDFVISLRSFQGGFELSNVLGISSPAYTIFDFAVPAEQDKLYWKTIFKTFKFIESLKTVTFGIRDGKSISFKEFGDLKLNYPSDVDEQRRIGEFFAKLDETIAANQHKLDLLKEQQKGYLQKMFPKNGAKVPELRFAGFADDWVQRKLGELGKTKSGIGFPDAQQGGTEGTPFYKVSDMNNPGNEVIMTNANNYASESQLVDNKWKTINPENSGVVFAKVGAAIFLDRKRIVDTPFLIDNNMMSYLFDSSWDRYFGKTLFENLRLARFAQVGALPSFNGSDVEDIKVTVPEPSEQAMIGKLFEQLDNLIAANQRKLDLLKEQKKGFLQKMFV